MLLGACAPTSGSANEFDINDWDSVVAAADGQTINWYMWGGSDAINAYVDKFYGETLKERYNITLNRVPVADAADYINQVLSEKEAGVENGAVDLMWINGENFFTLKQAECSTRIGRKPSPTALWSIGITPPSIVTLVNPSKTWKAPGLRRSSSSFMIPLAWAKMNFRAPTLTLRFGLVTILVASPISLPAPVHFRVRVS